VFTYPPCSRWNKRNRQRPRQALKQVEEECLFSAAAWSDDGEELAIANGQIEASQYLELLSPRLKDLLHASELGGHGF
jgi:hypothetical protein